MAIGVNDYWSWTEYWETINTANLITVESDDMWNGNPRDMKKEDLEFFGLESEKDKNDRS